MNTQRNWKARPSQRRFVKDAKLGDKKGFFIQSFNIFGEDGNHIEINEANSHLLSAAPELFAELYNIVENYRLVPIDKYNRKEEPKDAIQRSMKAISKTEGR